MTRPAVPASIKRDVLSEAGYRCAVPTCHAETLEIAHIVPWAEVKRHEFGNLIALCPTCHTRFDRGDIPRDAVIGYKRNLAILTARYSDLERRVLETFAREPERETIELLGNLRILIEYLIRDGYLEPLPIKSAVFVTNGMLEQGFKITEAGRAFVDRWKNGRIDA